MQLCLLPCLNSGLITEILKVLGKVDVKIHWFNKKVRVEAIVLAANLMYLLGGLSELVLFTGFMLFNSINTSSIEIGFKKNELGDE